MGDLQARWFVYQNRWQATLGVGGQIYQDIQVVLGNAICRTERVEICDADKPMAAGAEALGPRILLR